MAWVCICSGISVSFIIALPSNISFLLCPLSERILLLNFCSMGVYQLTFCSYKYEQKVKTTLKTEAFVVHNYTEEKVKKIIIAYELYNLLRWRHVVHFFCQLLHLLLRWCPFHILLRLHRRLCPVTRKCAPFTNSCHVR